MTDHTSDTAVLQAEADDFRQTFASVRDEVGKVIVGQTARGRVDPDGPVVRG